MGRFLLAWNVMSFSSSRTGSERPKIIETEEEDTLPSESSTASSVASWKAWELSEPKPTSGRWDYLMCPKCQHQSSTPTVIANLEGVFHCERCGYHGDARIRPLRFRETSVSFEMPWWTQGPLSPRALEWFEEQGIGAATLSQCEVGLTKSFFPTLDKWEPAFIFPCRKGDKDPVLDVISLHISQDLYSQTKRQPQALSIPWGWDTVIGQNHPQVIIVDHPIDRLALLEAGLDYVVCFPEKIDPRAPDSEQDWNFLRVIEKEVQEIGKFILALRDDDRGHAIEEELARRLGKERCFRTRWQHHRLSSGAPASAIDILREFGPEALQDEIATATPFPVAGVYELMDVEDRFDVLYEFGLQRGALTGWPSLDVHYTVQPGQWTLVTGIPGHGKSSWLDALLVNLAQFQGWKFGLFSPENQPIERHYASLMEKVARAPFNDGPTPRITPEVKDAKKSWLNEHFKVILPDDEKGNWTIDGVLQLAKQLVYRFGIKGLVIDPWNELDHSRPAGISETDHISASLTKIRRFARENDIHIWVVAHPAKLNRGADGKYPVPTMYDISGCYDRETEVLTSEGWVNHSQITFEHLVAVMDLDENILRYEKPQDILQFPWRSHRDGKLYRIQTDVLDALVTPNHRMVIKTPLEAEWKMIMAEEMKGTLQIPFLPFYAQHVFSSTRYLRYYRSEIGRLDPEVWSEPKAVLKDVLHSWWPETELETTFSVMLARDICKLAHLCGYEVIEHANSKGEVRLQRKIQPTLLNCEKQVTLEDYDGMVYCLRVSTGAYITRRHGKTGIYGNSAHWRNKADNGITIYRNVGEDDDDICDIHIQKIRFKEVGRVGMVSLRCDRRIGIYHDDLNQIERARALASGKIIPSADILVTPRINPKNQMLDDSHNQEDTDTFFDRVFGANK